MVILTNVLKHILIDRILTDIIGIFQREVLTFTISIRSKDTNDIPKVLNDNDINHVFSWSLTKTTSDILKET